VALSKVENAMKQSPFVENALCFALSTKSSVVALIVPAAPPLRAWAAANNVPADVSADFAQLCALPAAVAAVQASVQAACKKCKLAGFETPVKIALCDEPWTPENDCTTAAMKLKRQVITKVHAAALEAIYK
jgi:long-chain acyl-CoA synthetase